MDGADQRIADVRAKVAEVARRAGRDPRDIELIAVSKTFDATKILAAIEAGQRSFGENRVQEAQGKWPRLMQEISGLRLHLIGPLQTNKVREAVALFDAIHSLDRDKLAAALAREMVRQGRSLELFVQVNTGEERQKSGIMPERAADFVRRCRDVHGLTIAGLMCIPPAEADPVPHFGMLRCLAEALDVPSLSMGMSADFEIAIEYGATHVRVGSAIFGERG